MTDKTVHPGPPKEIWAVGGGKGGTGKTFLVSQLGRSLAAMGKRVILVDADFGGANLHSFLGIKRKTKSIKNFFDDKEPLETLAVKTSQKNLQIIPGDPFCMHPMNTTQSEKKNLLHQLKKLNADYILLDLPGGTHTDTVDIFLTAHKPILVTLADITAIDNLFQFIKCAYMRKLQLLLHGNKSKITVKSLWDKREEYGIQNNADLTAYIKQNLDPHHRIARALDKFSLSIVLNKLRNSSEILQGFSLKSLCIKHLGIPALYAGYITFDEKLWKSLSILQPLPSFSVSPRLQKEFKRITENIMNNGQMKIDGFKHE
jgi:flagellar biosynthesis protein FlhG